MPKKEDLEAKAKDPCNDPVLIARVKKVVKAMPDKDVISNYQKYFGSTDNWNTANPKQMEDLRDVYAALVTLSASTKPEEERSYLSDLESKYLVKK